MAPSNESPQGSSDHDDDDENLSAMLNELDVSDDFLGSVGGGSSVSPSPPHNPKQRQGDGEEAHLNGSGVGLEVSLLGEPLEETILENTDEDLVWNDRLQREEIFSHRYRPSKEELKELDDLETELGLKKPSSRRGSLFFFGGGKEDEINESEKAVWNQLVHRNTSNKEPSSILLKRGLCSSWRQGNLADLKNGSDDGDNASGATDEVECEAILLTHGLVVATVLSAKKSNEKQFSRAIHWSHVLQIQHVRPTPGKEDDDDDESSSNAWQIVLKAPHSSGVDPPEVWTFVCDTPLQQRNWFQAVERAFVEFHLHAGHQADLGWQYRYVLKPGFTMAVTGRVDNFPLTNDVITELDAYQGFAPLHYAVRCQNEKAVEKLLQAGADPNQPDREEERTPMDHAQRDHAPAAILDLLEGGGAKRSERGDDRGALFGQVAAVEEKLETEKLEREKQQLEEQKKAEQAQLQMQENMRLMQERGEKIDELGNKATELNQGAQDFASMAKMLKQKQKSKRWLPF